MISPFSSVLRLGGNKFTVERDGQIVAELDGLSNKDESGRHYIGFAPGAGVRINDWLINSSGDRFYVDDVKTAYFMGKPHVLNAYYSTETEHKAKSKQSHSAIFNIGSAHGSIIGTQALATVNYNDGIKHLKEQVAATESDDKEDLARIVALLEMVVNNQVPASKGLLSKFTETMERNSWIAGSIASTLLGWLTSQST